MTADTTAAAGGPVDLSITVVSHGHRHMLERYFASIFDSTSRIGVEVLLIDNTGADDAAGWVARRFPQARARRNDRPQSFAANFNAGVRELRRGRYVATVNPDVRCLPGLFDAAVAFMDANPDVALMGPQLLNPDGSLQPSCRRFPTPLVTLIRGARLDGALRHYGAVRHYLMTDADHTQVLEADWVTGALMIARRDAVESVGGMDERYKGAYAEDADLCCRLWKAGWRVCYVPQARAVHDHQREGVRKPWSRMARLQLVNTFRVYQKFGWKLTREG